MQLTICYQSDMAVDGVIRINAQGSMRNAQRKARELLTNGSHCVCLQWRKAPHHPFEQLCYMRRDGIGRLIQHAHTVADNIAYLPSVNAWMRNPERPDYE